MNKILQRTVVLFLLGTTCSTVVMAQTITQTIRGKIIDQDSRAAAIGATVFIVNSEPLIGTTTNEYGNFRLDSVPIGRVTLKVTYIGYKDKVLSNVQITSGKEVVLQVAMVEDVTNVEEVVVTANGDKRSPINDMSMVSSRTFSVEEAKRYAGTLNDPARAVSAFAGVNSPAEGENDIIVRGNSPKGILWRMEGIEIPNPNHFSEEGSSGGSINALNSTMLANSDFSTGAFAPEYGNALSGVFDIK